MVGVLTPRPPALRSLAELARAGAEVLDLREPLEDDEAVGRTSRADWPEAPILVGSDDTFNPKLNNVRNGRGGELRPDWPRCATPASTSSPRAHPSRRRPSLRTRSAWCWRSRPAIRPENFAAEMECSYINGHQARVPDGGGPPGHRRSRPSA